MKKKTIKKEIPDKKTQCFRCDGTGHLCNQSGETLAVCGCEGADGTFLCPDCKGTGK